MTHPVDQKIDELATRIVAAAVQIYGPDRLDEAVKVLARTRYLGIPGQRTCDDCGDVDQPEYQHFTEEHYDVRGNYR